MAIYDEYRFGMHVSTVWPNFQPLAGAKSSGTTASFERYDVPDTDARVFRISIYANTENNWASISEVAIYTRGGNHSQEVCGNGIDDDGDGLVDEGCSSSGTDPFGITENLSNKSRRTRMVYGHDRWSGFKIKPSLINKE